MSDKKKEFFRTVKFVLFSVSAGVIQIGSYTLIKEFLHDSPQVSHLISLALSVLWNFTLNRKFTFCSANNVPIAMLKTAAFYVVFTPLPPGGPRHSQVRRSAGTPMLLKRSPC